MRAFGDTSYFTALLLPRDQLHNKAKLIATQIQELVTSQFVLAELGAAMAGIRYRPRYVSLIERLQADSSVRIVHASAALFDDGFHLFRSRLDKAWSLVDCTSFLVMQRETLTEALTGDHHFEQAGFTALLK